MMQGPIRRDLERFGEFFRAGPPLERRIPKLSVTGHIVGVEWRAGTLLVRVNAKGIELITAGHNVVTIA